MDKKKTHILIAEDSLTQLVKLQYLLESSGYEVSAAHDGEEGLAMVKANPPDMVISDIVMPKMTGYELCSQIKADKKLIYIPVILLTSLSDPDDVIEALACSADNFVTKPYDDKFLISRIEHILVNIEMRKMGKADLGIEIFFSGKKHLITADRLQIVDLLFSTYENAVERNNELLEIQRRLKSSNELLQEARQEADRASRAKSDFLANMSHEIRTPMNAVIGLTHLALQTELTSKQKGYLGNIRSSANALLGIINDILDFSKIEAGQLDIENVPFQLSEVMNNLANIASVSAKNKDIELLFHISKDTPPWLKGDPLRLGQILINLTNNATKFTEKGEVVVSSRLIKQDKEQVTLQFTVKDTGIGMTPKQKSKLFKAFSQADSSTTRKFGGTGLGLRICKLLVEMMGGEIDVQTEAGSGSEFSFMISLDHQEPLEEEKIPGYEVLEGLHVLVIDDNRTARTIMDDMLSHMGMKVSLGSSGREALEIIKDAIGEGFQPYDLILMDWQMPDLDGMKIDPAPPTILMTTAYGHAHIQRRAGNASLDSFLIKPIIPVVLAETICRALGKTEEETAGPEKVNKQLTAGLQGKRILLVEDNLINQQVAQEILQGADIQVEVAVNGVEAVQRVKGTARPFDAIFMDVQMPEMDGLEATHRIRTVLGEEKLPIIAMTAGVMQSDLQACLDVGMNDVVSKPIDIEQLFTTLKKWLHIEDGDTESRQKPGVVHEEQSGTLPDSLVGINLQDALKRLGGNERLLFKLLQEFLRNGQTVCTKIRQAIDNSEWQEAQLLTHDLKGVAGNLSISKVHAVGQELEIALKQNKTDQFETLFESLKQEVDTVLTGLEHLKKREVATASSPVKQKGDVDITALTASIKDIAAMLKKNNLAAGQAFKELQQQLAGAGVDALLAKIESRIAELDFKGAEQAYSELAQTLQIS